MRAMRMAGLLALGCAPVPGLAWGQEVWQADVRIQTMNIQAVGKGGYSVRMVVTSDNDDDARSVRLDVLLPVGAGVLRATPGCRPSPSPITGLAGRVTCDLGTIPVRGMREIEVAMSTPRLAGRPRVAAMVMSDTPDPDPGNNYAERPLP